jgi:hypothetical protein
MVIDDYPGWTNKTVFLKIKVRKFSAIKIRRIEIE